MKRYLSSPFFLLALLCFFLPFFAVTCGAGGLSGLGGGGGGNQELTTIKGVDLLTGDAEEELADKDEFELPDLGPLGGPTPLPGVSPAAGESDAVDLGMSQIWAIAAAVIALLGIFLALIAGRAGGIMALTLGVAGLVLMFLLSTSVKGAVGDAVGEEAKAFIVVENKIGYWLTLLGFVAAAVTGLIRLLIPDRPVEAAPMGYEQPPGTPAPPPPPPDTLPPA